MSTKRKQTLHDQEKYLSARRLIKNDGYSIRKAATEMGIPYQTLRDHVNGKYSTTETSFGPKRLLSSENEESLSNYARHMASRGLPITRPVMKQLARDIVSEQGGGDVMPSDKWLRAYLKRHPELSLRKAHSLQRDRAAVSQAIVDDYFTLLEHTLTDLNLMNDSTRIYNCDESGFSGKLNPSKKVIVPKGTRHAYQSIVSITGHITMLNAISASGQTLPPMLIYSQCLPRQYSDGIPDSWVFETTDTGYINKTLFVEWFLKCFVPFVGQKRPVLLILDNHKTHYSKQFFDAAMKHKIELLFLPAHSSHLLQPQDVGYFHDLKQKVAELAVQLGYLGMKTLPRGVFPKVLLQALNKITGATVSSAFKCTGIMPLDRNAVSALLPSAKESTENDSSEKETSKEKSSLDASNQSSCVHCGHNKVNPLVKMGLIAPDLAQILIEPAVPAPKKSKRKTYTKARAVLTAEPCQKIQRLEGPVQPVQEVIEQGLENNTTSSVNGEHEDSALCIVCMMGTRDGLFWVGCDTCDKWYHYECLPRCIQVDVDLSIVTDGVWSCRYCQEE